MAETTQPKLRVSREEARQKIEAQIEKGQQLRDQSIDSDDELEEARAASEKWSAYNRTLLSSLFDNTSIAEGDYTSFDDFRGYVGSLPPFSEELRLYRRGMNRSINSLESIHERLELYDEPSEIQQVSGNEGVSGTPLPTLVTKYLSCMATMRRPNTLSLDS